MTAYVSQSVTNITSRASDDINVYNVQVLFSSPPSILSVIYYCITVLPVEVVSFKKHDAVLNLVLSSPLSHPCIRLARYKGDCEEKTEHLHTEKANERRTRGREEIPNKV